MEHFILETDIKVYCISASSFPDGVMAAHQALHGMVSFNEQRKYFGLSRPENNEVIVYKAAAEELISGELSDKNLEVVIIKKGNYQCISIHNFMTDIPAIGKAFEQLTALTDIDPEGYCVEWYITQQDVRCMVRLKTQD